MDELQTLSLFQVSEIELVYRSKVRPSDRVKVTSSSMAYEVFMAVWDMNKIELVEQAKILLLDASCQCLGVVDISTGGITACIVDPRIACAAALAARATSFVLAHSHPSGNPNPSEADKRMTARLAECGRLLEIKLWDSMVVCTDSYYSMQDNGLMPS